VKITKLNGRIGALLSNTNLTEPLPASEWQAIKSALLAHKVIFFRGQDGVDEQTLPAIAARLGIVTEAAHPTVAVAATQGPVSRVDSKDWVTLRPTHPRTGPNFWHTDSTFTYRPPAAAMLVPATLPDYGGETLWANTAAAYNSLPDTLRRFAESIWGVHSNRRGYGDPHTPDELPPRPDDEPPNSDDDFWGPLYETIHPIVHVHPESQERALVLGGHLRHIIGLDRTPARQIHETLQYYVERQENIIRWRWSLGDVAIFDNRATQHYAVSDYGEHPRLMYRVSFKGQALRAVNGQESIARIDGYVAPADAHTTGLRDPRFMAEEHGRR
jgi:alpha-ketoglutarate-dependent sulfate ester dioxygenase